MIDQVLNELEETKDKIKEELHLWFRFVGDMMKSVDVNLSTAGIWKILEPVEDSVTSADTESFCQREIRITVKDALSNKLHNSVIYRNHIKFQIVHLLLIWTDELLLLCYLVMIYHPMQHWLSYVVKSKGGSIFVTVSRMMKRLSSIHSGEEESC